MRLFGGAQLEWEKAEPAHFTGQARLARVAAVDGDVKLRIYRVEFEPRARTHWHTHTGVQLLHIVEGCCRVQRWGEPVREAKAGDIVQIAPDEKHWHGASPGGRMVHIAVNINAETAWLEPVSDEAFAGT